MDTITEYHFYKIDFWSAYNNNGKNIELALAQVSRLRNVEIEHLKVVLKDLIKKLNDEQ
jgi:hypothetical protein